MGHPSLPADGFGAALRAWRSQAGISQEELGFRAGMHRTYISKLERGLNSPSLDAVRALAAALGRTASELVSAAEVEAGRLGLAAAEGGASRSTGSVRRRRPKQL